MIPEESPVHLRVRRVVPEQVVRRHVIDDAPDARGEVVDTLRHYLLVGGMMAAVAAYVERAPLIDVQRLQSSIVATLQDDFAKYGTRGSRISCSAPIIWAVNTTPFSVYPTGGSTSMATACVNDRRSPTCSRRISWIRAGSTLAYMCTSMLRNRAIA